MPTFEYDVRFIKASLEQLESYLLAKDIFRPVGTRAPAGETPYPQMTLGALLLAKERAVVTALSPLEKAEIRALEIELEAMRARWRAAWGRKATAEFRARLNMWRDFLEDYRKHPDSNYDRYAYEISRRVMLLLLLPESLDLLDADLQMLAGLDGLLKAVFTPGEFVWDAALEPAFPEPTFWFLYGSLRKSLSDTSET